MHWHVRLAGLVALLPLACFNPDETGVTETDSGPGSSSTMGTGTSEATDSATTAASTTEGTSTTEPTTTVADASTTAAESSSSGGAGVCGDGTQDPGEDCDDGDLESGDGCSAACLDESNFCESALVGGFNSAFNLQRMVAADGYLYYNLSGTPSGLRVLDVADPANISQVGTLSLDAENYPNWLSLGLILEGDYLITAGREPELVVFDVSDPTSPQVAMQGAPNDGDGHIALQEGLLYESHGISERVNVRNASNLPDLPPVSNLGNPSEVFTNVGAFGSLAAITTNGGHMEIWGTEVPNAPTFEGEYEITPNPSPIRRILMDEDTIFLITGSGVILIDYANPAIPSEASRLPNPDFTQDAALRGDYLYVPRINGLQVWDVSNHDDPVLADNYLQVDAYANAVTYDETYVYLQTDDGLRVIEELPGFCESRCGNNHVEYPEDCDDGNLDDGDGCSASCTND